MVPRLVVLALHSWNAKDCRVQSGWCICRTTQSQGSRAHEGYLVYCPQDSLRKVSQREGRSLPVDIDIAQVWLRKSAEPERRLRLVSGGPVFQ